MKKNKLLLLGLAFTLSSCSIVGGGNNTSSSSEENSNNSVSTNSQNTESESLDTTTSESENNSTSEIVDENGMISIDNSNLDYEDLFDLNNKVNVTVDIEDKELQALENDFETGLKNETYHHAKNVTITLEKNGKKYYKNFNDVGIRQKGNTSRAPIFNNGYLAGLNHFKLSFDESFSDPLVYGSNAYTWDNETEKLEREDRNLLGLSGIDLKWNKNYDATHIKEIYASYMYQDYNIISQHIGLSTFNIKQVDSNRNNVMGLYTIYEPATKSLIKRSLKSNKTYVGFGNWKNENTGTFGVANAKYGDLYKCSYGIGEGLSDVGANLSEESTSGKKVGIGNVSGSYIPTYERKTNTDVEYDNHLLIEASKAVTSRNYSLIDSKLDLESIAISEAINWYLGNPDDFRNNNNNYEIYFRRTDGKGVIIPIDNDRCLGITKDWNPSGDGMKSREVFSPLNCNGENTNELLLSTILSNSDNACKTKYLETIKSLRNSKWTNPQTFEEYYQIAKTTYGNESCTSNVGAYLNFDLSDSNYSFENYITAKNRMVDRLDSPDIGGNDNNDTDLGNKNIYLAGTFNGWNAQMDERYKFVYASGKYSITFTPDKVEKDSSIIFKINNGYDWNTIDWTIEDNGDGTYTLVPSKSNNFVLKNVTTSSIISIEMDTATLDVKISIK